MASFLVKGEQLDKDGTVRLPVGKGICVSDHCHPFKLIQKPLLALTLVDWLELAWAWLCLVYSKEQLLTTLTDVLDYELAGL